MLNLSSRLSVIADCVGQDEKVADIGTDHGLLPIFLWKTQKSPKVILSDINEGPLIKAGKNINALAPEMHKDLRLGSGLETLGFGEVDTVIIAGMGGMLIKKILENDPEKSYSFRKYILQPRNSQDKLREWLCSHEFVITDECLAAEGRHICEVIVAVPGALFNNMAVEAGEFVNEISGLEFEISPLLFIKKDPLLRDFLEQKINKEKKIIEQIYCKGSEKSMKKLYNSQQRLIKLNQLFEQASL